MRFLLKRNQPIHLSESEMETNEDINIMNKITEKLSSKNNKETSSNSSDNKTKCKHPRKKNFIKSLDGSQQRVTKIKDLKEDQVKMENYNNMELNTLKKDNIINNKEKLSGTNYHEILIKKLLDSIEHHFKLVNHSRIRSPTGDKLQLQINIIPSDPEFPYELDNLELEIYVAPSTSYKTPYHCKVLNLDIPRTFAVNIEGAFIRQCNENVINLVDNLKWLDLNLTDILKRPEANIIKFVRRQPTTVDEKVSQSNSIRVQELDKDQFNFKEKNTLLEPEKSKIIISRPIENEATLRRQKEINQIERRFRRNHKVISNDENGYIFEVKLEPSDPDFKFKKECSYYYLTIKVPLLYPNKEHGISLKIKPGRFAPNIKDYMLRNVEKGFNSYATKSKIASILHCVNWLDSHIESLMLLPEVIEANNLPTPPKSPIMMEEKISKSHPEEIIKDKKILTKEDKKDMKDFDRNGKCHDLSKIFGEKSNSKLIESTILKDEEMESNIFKSNEIGVRVRVGSGEQSNNLDEMDKAFESLPPPTPHTGLQLRLPLYNLKFISLAFAKQLEVDLQCQRCKTFLTPPTLISHHEIHFQCPQCHFTLGARFRASILHESSDSLGYLDLNQAIFSKLNRLNLKVICSKCDHLNPILNGFKNMIPDSISNDLCRICHHSLGVYLGEVKLVRLAPTYNTLSQPSTSSTSNPALTTAQFLSSAPKREKLLLVSGTPLPNFGACKHYNKSYRWLRFPCCGMAFPCDTCHLLSNPATSEHDPQYATTSICGYCSREVNYFSLDSKRPTCPKCHHDLIGTSRGKAFWEGGQGVRDPLKMSKNEPKKYSGMSKTISKKKSASNK